MTAREAVRRLKSKDVSPHELIDAALSRIAKVEPSVNALPTLCEDRARDFAANLSGNPDQPGWLAGLPVAIKDMNEVGGVRTTYGSPIYADHVPEKSDITVTAMEALGATVLAKSNTPEFAAGANTFNEVFGKTLNPWNTALTCGGSSGGSAVALATGEVWLAGGSDLGGSLRTPAAFCSVVGYRPSPGRVRRAGVNPFDTMGVNGPMALIRRRPKAPGRRSGSPLPGISASCPSPPRSRKSWRAPPHVSKSSAPRWWRPIPT